jgi:hypothetical protein
MPVLLNVLPNIYWMYNNPSSSIPEGDYAIALHKVRELYGIKTLVELDSVLAFWNKSSAYINEIKNEMEKNEFSKLLAIYKKLLEAIKKGYLGNAPMLISTYKADYVEIGLGVWIYFFHINAGMSFDAVIKLLGLKVIGAITMSDLLKKFFAFLNMTQIK